MTRKQLYNMIFDMMKDGDISGAQFIGIIRRNLATETSDSVISDNLQWNIPAVIKGYIPIEHYEKMVKLDTPKQALVC